MERCAITLNCLCCQASLVASLYLVTTTMPCDSARADPAGAGVLVEHATSGRHSRFAPHAFATQEAICVFSGSLINSTGSPHVILCTWTVHRLQHSARQGPQTARSSASAHLSSVAGCCPSRELQQCLEVPGFVVSLPAPCTAPG